MSHTHNRRRVRVATALLALLVLGIATAAGAHPRVARWWQYDKSTWHQTWRADARLFESHVRWHHRHEHAAAYAHRQEHHDLALDHRRIHFHRAISWDSGQATWYDGDGRTGACGVALHGLYAASRTLPCGALVSVRSGGRYVLLHILDRGPFGSSSRILDLSPQAFSWLAPQGAGVISVRVVRLRR